MSGKTSPQWVAQGALPASARLLIGARMVRSIGQGALVVDFSLYLHQLRWSSVQISATLSAALLVGATLTLLVGPLSDRVGRRHFLMGFEVAQILACTVACLTSAPWLLVPAAIVGGFGRGGNGAAGPFAPVEQAWLAQGVAAGQRGRLYSRNAAGGFVGMALGALLAAAPTRLSALLPGALSFRPLFALAGLCAAACLLLLARAHDAERQARHGPGASSPADGGNPADPCEATLRQHENRNILRLALTNLTNGIGIGLTGPLMSYWFAIRFAKGPEFIGPMMALGFLLAGFSSLGAGRLASAMGIVRSVVLMRLIGLACLLALPFAPTFASAATLYTVRNFFNRGTIGTRNALSVGLVRPSRRGFAASISSVSMQVPRAVGPVFAGLMFQAQWLALPFVIGAAFQGAFVYLYYRHFAHTDADPR